jgi:hypothetical protein
VVVTVVVVVAAVVVITQINDKSIIQKEIRMYQEEGRYEMAGGFICG